MTANLPVPGSDDGKAMAALNERQRIFVISLFESDVSGAEAARIAGYGGINEGSARVQASRLLAQPKIQEAIREYGRGRMAGLAPEMIRQLESVAKSPQHKDQVKAIVAMLNRGGLHEVVERNVNVNVTLTSAEKLERLRELAIAHGDDPARILGNLTDVELKDGEYQVIEETPAPDFSDEEY